MSTSGTLIQKNGPVKIKGFLIAEDTHLGVNGKTEVLIFKPDHAHNAVTFIAADWRFEPDGPPPHTLTTGLVLQNIKLPATRFLMARDIRNRTGRQVNPTHWVDLRSGLLGELSVTDRNMFADPTKYRKEG